MKANIINALIYIVFAIGLLGAGDLVLNEIRESNICPKILGIPACYIILTCFVLPFLMHVFKGPNSIYFALTGLAFVIALVASYMQFTGIGECPKTANGTPMCYYSLALFTSLIVLKVLHLRWGVKVIS